MSNIIAQIEAEQMTSELPTFSAGDTVIVKVRVKFLTVKVLSVYSRRTASL